MRWVRSDSSREELAAALVQGRVAGPVTSHDRGNVIWKIEQFVMGEPGLQFGIRDLPRLSVDEVLALVAEEAGFDPLVHHGPTPIDPELVLDAWAAAGSRLEHAARKGERIVFATGHPAGLVLLYMAIGRLAEEHGAKLLMPARGLEWREAGRHRQIRYLNGVAVLTDRGSTIHTHSPGPMQLMLEDAHPDLVVADHGFAGAAIQAGVDTISIADVNDPAPVVAKWQGRTEIVVVMDDNVQPDDYWPCFQALAAEFA